MVNRYHPNLEEFIRAIVSYYGIMDIDDLVKMIKICKRKSLTSESVVHLGALAKEGNIARVRFEESRGCER